MLHKCHLPSVTSAFFILLTLAMCMPAVSNEPVPLKYSISDALTLPLANVSIVNGQVKIKENEGLLVKLGQEIAKELDLPLKILPVRRKHVVSNLLNGKTDILCYLIPGWVATAASSFNWSDTFMSAKDILISSKSNLNLSTFEDLQGLNIGLIKHYSYPVLQDMIDRKEIFPIYASTEINAFMQLFRNPDVDAIVFKDLNFDWLYSAHGGALTSHNVVKHSLVIEYIEPRCAVSRNRALDMKKINKAIARFKKKRHTY